MHSRASKRMLKVMCTATGPVMCTATGPRPHVQRRPDAFLHVLVRWRGGMPLKLGASQQQARQLEKLAYQSAHTGVATASQSSVTSRLHKCTPACTTGDGDSHGLPNQGCCINQTKWVGLVNCHSPESHHDNSSINAACPSRVHTLQARHAKESTVRKQPMQPSPASTSKQASMQESILPCNTGTCANRAESQHNPPKHGAQRQRCRSSHGKAHAKAAVWYAVKT
ncbi:hypothetical protein COO60DRAFT_203188 [Scenedesmus sp. NREL 46B-D3]|nr:hypothetical protein COO60DRAFT_203188 [Scenedesmus sp. NREL 46B-D3]